MILFKLFYHLNCLCWTLKFGLHEISTMISTWIGKQPCMQIDFWQFSRNNTYVRIPGKFFRNPFACMVVLQSMWKGPNHFWNFTESGSESATYLLVIFGPRVKGCTVRPIKSDRMAICAPSSQFVANIFVHTPQLNGLTINTVYPILKSITPISV